MVEQIHFPGWPAKGWRGVGAFWVGQCTPPDPSPSHSRFHLYSLVPREKQELTSAPVRDALGRCLVEGKEG